ncbi:MAG: hypothetical protein P8J33_10235 [Pirellulaceae bacterium]|nr:hypothetical protein [Pirellulaceae bacterium]
MTIRTLLILAVLFLASTARAQGPSLEEQSTIPFRPFSAADHVPLRENTISALASVHNDLTQLDPAIRLRLKHVYQLEVLQELLQTESTDVPILRDIERNFYSLQRDYQLGSLMSLRNALSADINFLTAIEHDDPYLTFQTRMESLFAELDNENPDTYRIARTVDWMMTTGQSPELVREVQQRFSHPSICVDVSPELFLPMLAEYRREIDKSEFAKNNIMGVPVQGTSRMKALITPDLIYSTEYAGLRLNINGQIESPKNEASPDPQRVPVIGNVSVKLQSRGETSVQGTKEIFWNGQQLTAKPAEVICETKAELEDVDISRKYRRPNRRIAQRLDHQIKKRAYSEVKKNSSRTNAEAAELAANLVGKEIDVEVATLLGDANEKINEFYVQPLNQLGMLPIGTSFASSTAIRIGFRGTNGGAIAAPARLPNRRLSGDLELSAHETMSSNLWAGYLKGRRLTDREFKNVHRELRGFVPQALRLAGHQPWEVRLDHESPLVTRFQDGQIRLTLRMQSITVAEQTWHQPFSVSASYRVLTGEDMPRFERSGAVDVEWFASLNEDPSSTAMQTLVNEKFNAFFARQMHLDGMSAPVGGAWGSAAELKIIDSQIYDGWWRLIFKAKDLNRLK